MYVVLLILLNYFCFWNTISIFCLVEKYFLYRGEKLNASTYLIFPYMYSEIKLHIELSNFDFVFCPNFSLLDLSFLFACLYSVYMLSKKPFSFPVTETVASFLCTHEIFYNDIYSYLSPCTFNIWKHFWLLWELSLWVLSQLYFKILNTALMLFSPSNCLAFEREKSR